MELTERQQKIIEIVKKNVIISGEKISVELSLTRSALRTDFSFLVKSKILISKPKMGYSYNPQEKSKTKIKELMSPPISVDYEKTVYETILYMFKKDVGTLFVVKKDSLVGIVSRKDLLKIAMTGKELNKIPINIIMTRMPNIVFAEENEFIIDGVEKLINHEIDSLPIVRIEKKNNKIKHLVVGRFTKTNITKYFFEINK